MKPRRLSLIAALMLAATAQAQVTVLIDSDRVYVIRDGVAVRADSVLVVKPLVDKPDPTPTGDLSASVKTLTDKQSGDEYKVILAALYSNAAEKVRAGTWTVKQAEAEIRDASKSLLPGEWAPWTKGVGELLDDRARRGTYNADAFSEVSSGIRLSMASRTFASAKAERAFKRGLLLKVLPLLLELFADGDFEFDFKTILKLIGTFL